jgi:hypothetical protein
MRPSDPRLDRILAGGRPGGAELDHVWARIRKTRLRERCRAWLPRVALGFAPVAVAATAWLLWLPPAPPVERGGEVEVPLLEADCGTAANPCAVSFPMHLRVHGGGDSGTLAAFLDNRPIVGPVDVPAGATVVLPITLTPERQDVAHGVSVTVRFLPTAGAALDDLGTRGAARTFTFRVQNGPR